MSTVQTVLNGVRYDLRNYADIDFDSDQLIHYLNRAIILLDYSLGSHNSDHTLNKGTVTLSSGETSVAVPTNAFNIREVWVDDDRKQNLDQMALYHESEFRDSDAQEFSYWTHIADNIVVEVAAASDTTLTVYYDKLSTAVTSESSTMPYNGRFDEALREAVVLMSQAKKYKSPMQADAMYKAMFDEVVQMDTLNRKFVKKPYRLDF